MDWDQWPPAEGHSRPKTQKNPSGVTPGCGAYRSAYNKEVLGSAPLGQKKPRHLLKPQWKVKSRPPSQLGDNFDVQSAHSGREQEVASLHKTSGQFSGFSTLGQKHLVGHNQILQVRC